MTILKLCSSTLPSGEVNKVDKERDLVSGLLSTRVLCERPSLSDGIS